MRQSEKKPGTKTRGKKLDPLPVFISKMSIPNKMFNINNLKYSHVSLMSAVLQPLPPPRCNFKQGRNMTRI